MQGKVLWSDETIELFELQALRLAKPDAAHQLTNTIPIPTGWCIVCHLIGQKSYNRIK